MSKADEVIKSVADGIADLKKDRDGLGDIGVLTRVKFSKQAGSFTMQVGGSPIITFDKPKPSSTEDKKVDYLVRMAIQDASFSNEGKKELCIERASFFSEVTPGAEFALTYELMSFCKPATVYSKFNCIRFPPKAKVEFILPYYERCSTIDSNESEKLAECMCKALKINKKFPSKLQVEDSSDDSSSNSESAAQSAALPNDNSSSSARIIPFSPLLIIILLWSLGFLNRRH